MKRKSPLQELLERQEDLRIAQLTMDYAVSAYGETGHIEKDIPVDKLKEARFLHKLGRSGNARRASVRRRLATAAAVVLIIGSGAGLLSVDAVRKEAVELLMSVGGGEFGTTRMGNGLYIPKMNLYVPEYIPNGYTVQRITRDGTIQYTDAHDHLLLFVQQDYDAAALVDLENTQHLTVEVRGRPAALLQKDSEQGLVHSLIWEAGQYRFCLQDETGNLSDKDLICVAESVKYDGK